MLVGVEKVSHACAAFLDAARSILCNIAGSIFVRCEAQAQQNRNGD
jgi:hypothetical protein